MRTPTLRPLRASLSLVLFPLAMLAGSASLLACSGDDTNPAALPVPDAGSPFDATTDGPKPDGATDSGTPADSGGSDAGDAADSGG